MELETTPPVTAPVPPTASHAAASAPTPSEDVTVLPPAPAPAPAPAPTPTPAPAARPATPANYNVRQLLELERKIYEESIEKQVRQHDALLRGSLNEYLVQCLPIEKDCDREMDVAKKRLLLNRRNAEELLAFELKQADDVYQTQCQELKRRLVEAAERKRKRITRRLEQIDNGEPLTTEDDELFPKLGDSLGGSSPADHTRLITSADGSLDTAVLEKHLHLSLQANQAAFNLGHLEHNLPPASAIVSDVVEELERQKAYQKEVNDPDTVCGVVVDPIVGKVWIDLMDVFTVQDNVVLWSSLSDEDFHGQITKIQNDRIDLALVCGSRIHVSVEQLRKQLCTLRHPPEAPQGVHGGDERAPRTPKRKRNRRKHTIGMRQKI